MNTQVLSLKVGRRKPALPNLGIQRVMFQFWGINGQEGYVLATHAHPYLVKGERLNTRRNTIYSVHILGHRYLRWTFHGTLSMSEMKERVETLIRRLERYTSF
jgi:hypothetical protein